MAATPQVAGACAIYVAYASVNSGNPLLLGYTANGAMISETPFFENIPGDQNGGDSGPPIEIQHFGEIVHVQLELTKWDVTIANHIRKMLDGATLGTPTAAGSLMFTAALTARLTLVPLVGSGIGTPLNYNRALTRNSIDVNLGTKHARLVCQFECHKDANGVLWNNSVTGI